MADQAKQGDSTVAPGFSFAPLLKAAPQIQHLMLFAPRLQAALLRAAVNQQKEAAAFVSRRCDEELRLAGEIGNADSFKDVYAACMGFWQKAASQYAHEVGRVAEVRSRSAIDIVDELRHETIVAAEMQTIKRAA